MTDPAVYIQASGKFNHRPPFNGKRYTLNELQALVGGYIEIIGTPAGNVLVINEEGRTNGSALNVFATDIARQPIFGDAVYTSVDLMSEPV